MGRKPKTPDLTGLPEWQQRFARELRAQMKVQGLSNRDIGEHVGKSAEMVREWQRGTSEPRIGQVLAVAEILGTTFADLTGIGLDD